MSSHLRVLFVLVLALGAGVAACSESTTPLVCRDRGCFNGLTVLLEEPLPAGAVVSLELGVSPWTVTCGENTDCSHSLHFEDLRSEHVIIRVRTPSLDRTFEFQPEYRTSKPNGPDCPGECFQAEITLPALGEN